MRVVFQENKALQHSFSQLVLVNECGFTLHLHSCEFVQLVLHVVGSLECYYAYFFIYNECDRVDIICDLRGPMQPE